MRTRVCQFDLKAPRAIWNLEGCQAAQILVRKGRVPAAYLQVRLPPRTAVLTIGQVMSELVRQGVIRDIRGERGEDPTEAGQAVAHPPISVVVCTRDRPHALQRCLRALESLDYRRYEVIVVDNASSNPQVREVVQKTGFRYVREEMPGPGWARNRGIAEAAHETIAYVDDDATADPHWLTGIAEAFRDPAIAVATGLVLPAELHTPAEHLFERYGGMRMGLVARTFAGAAMSPRQKIGVGCAGAGANMAYRRRVFDRVGRFDTALDGTSSNGGGELDMFHRVLADGLSIRYEPGAIVWHYHRRSMRDLRRQLYNKSCAYGVYLINSFRTGRVSRSAVAGYGVRDWIGIKLLGRWLETAAGFQKLPGRFALAELWGACHSPWAFWKSRRTDRRRRRSQAAAPDARPIH